MSKYFSEKLKSLLPYTPGEQPKNMQYIKLNTNENAYCPSQRAVAAIDALRLNGLRLYSDPECSELCKAVAECYGVLPSNVLPTNGSDEALAFCFAAFGECGMVFPDVTYGFYKVFANLFCLSFTEIPLEKDFTVNASDYVGIGKTIVLANPNAQTGIYLELNEIENIVKSNSDNVVIVDEAYIDFGGKSAVELVNTYDNLVVIHTFSKSRALAGARVGYAIASEQLINDLRRVKYSFNPYNVNTISSELAAVAIRDKEYTANLCSKIVNTRKRLTAALCDLGYEVLPSAANFVLAKSPTMSGERLYAALKARAILVRHFSDARISDYVRITIGTDEQTDILLQTLSFLENEKPESAFCDGRSCS